VLGSSLSLRGARKKATLEERRKTKKDIVFISCAHGDSNPEPTGNHKCLSSQQRLSVMPFCRFEEILGWSLVFLRQYSALRWCVKTPAGIFRLALSGDLRECSHGSFTAVLRLLTSRGRWLRTLHAHPDFLSQVLGLVNRPFNRFRLLL
jgi:hypothetical protein